MTEDRLRTALREVLAWAPTLTSSGYRAAARRARTVLDATVLPDSDAPTPREATPVDGLREALQDLPFSRQWPTQKPPGEWYVRVEDAISFMVEERAREAQAGSRSARSSTALQAAASTAAAGEGATDLTNIPAADMTTEQYKAWLRAGHPAVGPIIAGEGATGDVDAAWEALREAIRWHRGSLGDADPLIEHRPLIEAAIRFSRATSETPRETPLAATGIDVAAVLRRHQESQGPWPAEGHVCLECWQRWPCDAVQLAAAARGPE